MSDDGKTVPCPRCEGAGKLPMKSTMLGAYVTQRGGRQTLKRRRLTVAMGCNVCNGAGRVPEADALLWLQTMHQGDY